MAKTVELTDVSGLSGFLQFNALEGTDYYPGSLTVKGDASGDGVRKSISTTILLGNGRATPYTPRELYTRLTAAFSQQVADAFKDVYIAGIDDDISV